MGVKEVNRILPHEWTTAYAVTSQEALERLAGKLYCKAGIVLPFNVMERCSAVSAVVFAGGSLGDECEFITFSDSIPVRKMFAVASALHSDCAFALFN